MLLLRAEILSPFNAESAMPVVLFGLFGPFSISSVAGSGIEDERLCPSVDCLRRVDDPSVFLVVSISDATLSLCGAPSLGTEEVLLDARETGF